MEFVIASGVSCDRFEREIVIARGGGERFSLTRSPPKLSSSRDSCSFPNWSEQDFKKNTLRKLLQQFEEV